MKNIKILSLVLIILITLLAFVSCANNIEYKIENIDCDLNNEYVYPLQMINPIRNTNEMSLFFNNKQFGKVELSDFSKFNDSYFKNNVLLIICYAGDANTSIDINSVFIRSSELFVGINSSKISGNTHYKYKFITIEKELVKNVEKYSYIIKY